MTGNAKDFKRVPGLRISPVLVEARGRPAAVRWSAHGKGTRGGARVIYLLLVKAELIYLFYAYTKG